MSKDSEIRNHSAMILSDDWAVLTKHTFELKRRDGVWEKQIRQTYDRGHGAVILPYDPVRKTVLLVRQFRMPAFVEGHKTPLIEACAGLLDQLDPETAIRKEAEEELGYRLRDVTKIYEVYMSPGSVTERLSFFVGHYSPTDRISDGGGCADEGEDIEVLEMTLSEAMGLVKTGGIIDAKTVMLIQYAVIEGLGA
jgi:nudix-type nucleoside diphosphatase (YffH/AdpP family)